MFRTILSYSALILIPAVSLAIAVVPYVWVKRKSKRRNVEKPAPHHSDIQELVRGSESRQSNHNSPQPSLILREGEVKWNRLWLAFGMGLAGNVVWSALVINRPTALSDYIFQTDYSGMLFGWLFYALFIAVTPFVFFKYKYGHLNIKHIVYCIILSLLIVSLEIGGGIILFFIGWNRLFYAFN